MNIECVESITVEYGGFFGGTERRVIKHNGDQIVVERLFFNGASDDGIPLYENITWFGLLKRMDALIKDWKEEYNDPDVLDGTQWSLDIEYVDGKEEHYWGSNMFPDNFEAFLNAIEMKR